MFLLQPKRKIVSATLLVMGSMIGTGMIGMPTAQGASGLLPGYVLLLFCWLYTFCCSRLLLEACSWLPRGANFLSITTHLLGKKSAFFCWFFYAIYFYSAITSHIAAAGEAIGGFFQHGLSDIVASILFTAFFACFVYNSIRASDRLNRLLMLGLSLTCFIFILTIVPFIDFSLFRESHWSQILPAMQVFLYAFSFQYIIPPLYSYLECDTNAMKKAIWIGTIATLILYMIWFFLVLGIVPGTALEGARQLGDSSIHPLEKYLKMPLISGMVHEFIILALSTSFLAVSISFLDFWVDTLKWDKRGVHGIFLIVLVFIIPLVLAINFPSLFIDVLDIGGIFGATFVFGIFPALFVWSGRYRKYHKLSPELLPGGKTILVLVILVSIAALLIARI